MKPEHYDILHAALSTCLKADPGDINPSDNLIEVGLLDSLDAMAFLFEVEKASGKKIGEGDGATVEDLSFNQLSAMIAAG